MNMTVTRVVAAALGIVFIAVFLLAPLVSMGILGSMPGFRLMSSSPVMIVALAFGIGMVLCSLFAPKLISIIVNAVGAFVPMIFFFIIQSKLASGSELVSTITQYLGGLSGIAGIGDLIPTISMGSGVFINMVIGILAAVLCGIEWSPAGRRKTRSPGYGADGDDDDDL